MPSHQSTGRHIRLTAPKVPRRSGRDGLQRPTQEVRRQKALKLLEERRRNSRESRLERPALGENIDEDGIQSQEHSSETSNSTVSLMPLRIALDNTAPRTSREPQSDQAAVSHNDTQDVVRGAKQSGGRRTRKPRESFAKQLLQPEYLEEVPHDLETDWLAVPYVPEGRRVLAVVQRHRASGELRMTLYSRKRGEAINPAFVRSKRPRKGRRKRGGVSAPPGGTAAEGNHRDFSFPIHIPIPAGTKLDCIFAPASCALYALDLLQWGGRDYRDCDVEFRSYWLEAKLNEARMERPQAAPRGRTCPRCSRGWLVPHGIALPVSPESPQSPEVQPVQLEGAYPYPFIILPLKKVSPAISIGRWLRELIEPTLKGRMQSAQETGRSRPGSAYPTHPLAPTQVCIDVALRVHSAAPAASGSTSYTTRHLPAFLPPPRQDGLLLCHRYSTYESEAGADPIPDGPAQRAEETHCSTDAGILDGMELAAIASADGEDDSTTPLACWIPVSRPVSTPGPRHAGQSRARADADLPEHTVATEQQAATAGGLDDDDMQGDDPEASAGSSGIVIVEDFAQMLRSIEGPRTRW